MKVLLVGLGSIARKHIDALRSIDPSVELFAWRSSDSSQHWEGITDLYDWEKVKEEGFNFAIISNPTSKHKESIRILSELYIPLFIEKPLFHRLDIEELVNRVASCNVLTYVACNLRFLGALSYVKEYLREQQPRLNEVNIYCGSFLPDWRKGIDFRQNYSAIPDLGGGVHLDLIHEMDYVYWLFGYPQKIHSVFSNKSSLDIQSYDYANYCLEYSGFCVGIVLNYYRKDTKRTLELVCDKGTISIDLLKDSVAMNGEILYQSEQGVNDTYLAQMKYFMNCLQENRKSFNTISDAYRVLQICLES